MKTSPRIQRNGATKSAVPQAKTARRAPEPVRRVAEATLPPAGHAPQGTDVVVPSKIVRECKDALSLLEGIGFAGGALVMMNAEVIEESVNAFDGWQALESPGFGQGSRELGRTVINEFHVSFTKLAAYAGRLMAQIEDCSDPVKSVSRSVYHGLIQDRAGSEARIEIEDAVGSLKHCIEIQSTVLDSRHNEGAYDMGMQLKKRLEAAFKTVWRAVIDLEGAFLAATVAYDQSAVRRMIA